MESWASWIIQTVTMLGIGALGFFLKQTIAQIKDSLDKQDKRITTLEEKINDTLQALPYQYALKDEVIRSNARLEQKLDKVYDEVTKLWRQEARNG